MATKRFGGVIGTTTGRRQIIALPKRLDIENKVHRSTVLDAWWRLNSQSYRSFFTTYNGDERGMIINLISTGSASARALVGRIAARTRLEI